MKNTIMSGLFCLLSVAGAALAQAQPAGSGIEKAIIGLEDQWAQSQRTNNPDLLAPLLADKFVNTGADGKVTNKAELLANAKKTKWTSVEYSNVQVAVTGDTAIATGTFKGKGTDSAGKPVDDNERFTDTWVKMPGGTWQCVASHGSNIKK
jgi:hypothetical protein